MAKKLNFVNDVQSNDSTANKAVEANVPTWANKTKVGGRSHDEMLRLELELEFAKKTMRAVNAERRKADKREAEARHDYITALVAMAGKYSDAVEAIAASMNTVYAQVTPSGVASVHNAQLRAEATNHASIDNTLHIVEEKTVQDPSVRAAKKTAKKDATTAKKTAKKDATTATTAKKTTTGKGKGKYTSKTKKAVQYEEEYTVTAKNGVVYKVGHFHHTKTDEELWAVSCVEFSDDAKTWLKDTFGVHWSPFAGGFLFDYKPDTYLRRGVAKKTTAKKTAKKNA